MLILLLNLFDLILGIIMDLLHRLSIVFLQRFDLLFQLLDLSLLRVDEVLMFTLELVHLFSMLFKDGHLDLVELPLLLLVLVKQGLVPGGIFQHAL